MQMVVLMDPMEDPDDVLRANRSREKSYMFDAAFDFATTQVRGHHIHTYFPRTLRAKVEALGEQQYMCVCTHACMFFFSSWKPAWGRGATNLIRKNVGEIYEQGQFKVRMLMLTQLLLPLSNLSPLPHPMLILPLCSPSFF